MPTWFALLVLLQLVEMLEWHRYAVISQTLLWDVMGSAIELLHPQLITLLRHPEVVEAFVMKCG